MQKIILTILFLAVSAGSGHAQLGGIKNAIKDKTSKPSKGGDEPKTPPRPAADETGGAPKAPITGSGGLLDHVLMDFINYSYDNRRVYIEQARAMNLSSAGADVSVTMRVKAGDGKMLATYQSNAQAPKRNKSFWMNGFNGVEGTQPDLYLPGAGDYYLEFSAGGKVFDRFPFTINTYTGDKGQLWFVMDGLWNDHAMIDTSKEFAFNIWMRDMLEGTGKRDSSYAPYSAKLVRESDGKVIGKTATWIEKQTLAPMRKWTRYTITFVQGAGEGAMGIYDVTAQDGNYYIEFTHDKKVYGKYPFKVQGGKLRGVTEFRGTELDTQDGDLTWLRREGGRL